MYSQKTIKFDYGVTLKRSADGIIMISQRGGACTWSILALAVFAFGCLGWVLILTTTIEDIFSVLIFVVSAIAIVSPLLLPVIQSLRITALTIDPIKQVVMTGKQNIPFDRITEIGSEEKEIHEDGGIVDVKFILFVNPNRKIEVGRKSMETGKPEKINEFKNDVITLIEETIWKSKKGKPER